MKIGAIVALLLMASCAPAYAQCSPDVVPFEFHGGRMILVKGTIAGVADRTVVIDTGTFLTVIDRALAQRLRLRKAGAIPVAGPIATEGMPTVVVPVFQLGNVEFHGIRAVEADLGAFSKAVGIQIDGFIGLDALGHGSLMIDFATSTIRIAASTQACKPAQSPINEQVAMERGIETAPSDSSAIQRTPTSPYPTSTNPGRAGKAPPPIRDRK